MLILKVEVKPLTYTSEAFERACELSRKLDVIVEFSFNGIPLRADPRTTPEQLRHEFATKPRPSSTAS